MSLLGIAVVLAFMATLFSLVSGVSSMAAGTEVARRTSEQWMIRRIAFQAATVVLLLLALVE